MKFEETIINYLTLMS